MAEKTKNTGASVRARLKNFAVANGQNFDLVLTRYAFERFLFRLGRSHHAERFVLKGAMLLMVWLDYSARVSRDLDFLGFGEPDPDTIIRNFREVMAQDTEDGVTFDIDALRIERIRENTEYGGFRLRTHAVIDGARIGLTIDIGFGDTLEPGGETIDYPVMLDFPAPKLRAYARETVIAEKFQAMTVLGRANTRMKDFYDIWILSRYFRFEDDRLARAVAATFKRRATPIPVEPPDALTPGFAADEQKQREWNIFAEDVEPRPGSLAEVVESLSAFIMPHARKAAGLAE